MADARIPVGDSGILLTDLPITVLVVRHIDAGDYGLPPQPALIIQLPDGQRVPAYAWEVRPVR